MKEAKYFIHNMHNVPKMFNFGAVSSAMSCQKTKLRH